MMKQTPQRMAVEQIALSIHTHPTADDVYSEVVKTLPTVSKATVYRILNALSEEGVLRKVSVHGGADRFDYITVPHSHIRCTVCGRVDDVTALFTPDTAWIRESHGYRVTGCLMSFEGVCADCQKKSEKKEL